MNVSLQCNCGALRGIVENVSPSKNLHVICYCDDCQAYQRFLGRADDVLDASGGTEIFAVTPSQLKLLQGADRLRCLRLGPKGLFRWYASCCKTPIANSPPSARMPYHGVVHVALARARDEAFGPVQGKIFGKFATGPTDAPKKISLSLVLRTARFLLTGVLGKKHTPSALFDENGEPIVEPYVLTPEERDSARSKMTDGAEANVVR
jgi:hypothetical protein